ncbi:MAG TPA: DUF6807 family protein [Luteolibacter sp.]|nr:DUF6807 family protein [Luteolibacter sp.]
MKTIAAALTTLATTAALVADNAWTTVEEDGRVLAKLNGKTVLGFQKEPLGDPKGGEKFAGSQFIHPLATPSGFVTTELQPSDHLHHFALWWPWKFIEVDGKRHNSWEIQNGEGAHVADGVEVVSKGPDSIQWRIAGHVEARGKDTEPRVVIRENTDLAMSLLDDQTIALDLTIRQRPDNAKVVIGKNHYSGLGWRGTPEWNGENSKLVTSEGHNRDNGNGQPVRWILITGEQPGGKASVVLMSAASETGEAERMRVWNAKMHSGHHFVNLNPVAQQSIPLDEEHPAVSQRRYRIVTSDREIDTQQAEALWKSWLGK